MQHLMNPELPPSFLSELERTLGESSRSITQGLPGFNFLEEEEIKLLKHYISAGSLTEVSHSLKMDELEAYFLLRRAIFKLKLFKTA
jgi:hypothetical protein